jgi:ABC-type dipeptide/oligopeptide/nickel transport system permease subunit
MEPSDYYDAPVDKVLHFIRGVGLIKGYLKGKHDRSLNVAVQGLVLWPTLIHTYIRVHTFPVSMLNIVRLTE